MRRTRRPVPPLKPAPKAGFFVANAGALLRRAWSVRLIVLSTVLSALEVAVPFLDGVLPLERGRFAAMAFAVTLAAGVARFVSQGIDE